MSLIRASSSLPGAVTSMPKTIKSIWEYYPVGDGVTDDSAAFTSALGSGAKTIDLGSTGTFRVAATIPAGVTLRGSGALLKPVASATARYIVRSGGVGARMVGLRFDASADSSLLGNERCIEVGHADVQVLNCHMLANGFRYGVYVEHASGGSCDNTTIEDCTFLNTSFGVLKQGSNGTTANKLKITGNRFDAIRRGDAIELNVGADRGVVVEQNWINDVTADGVTNTGFGIGIAGGGVYGGAETGQPRNCRVTGNHITNCEVRSIHIEKSSRFDVESNIIYQTSTPTGSSTGITLYGSTYCTVRDNQISSLNYGITDDLGVTGGLYVVSTNGNLIQHNRVSDCGIRGIYSGVAGDNRTVRVQDNVVERCPVGIQQQGAATVYFVGNRVEDCPTPFSIDMAPAGKALVASGFSNILHVVGNRAYWKGVPQARSNTLSNVTGTLITESANNFTIGAPNTSIYDYHQPGEVILDAGVPKLCTVAGWTAKTATNYFFQATAGNTYVVVTSPGDPANKFVVGQRISLTGAGAAAGTLSAYILRIYVQASQYRLAISETVVTSVGTSTTITLEQTATYLTLATV